MPSYNFPSSQVGKKRTALPYEIHGKRKVKFDWEGVLGWGLFIAAIIVGAYITYFNSYVLPTWGI